MPLGCFVNTALPRMVLQEFSDLLHTFHYYSAPLQNDAIVFIKIEAEETI
jgi:hypothetical protein